MIMATSFNTTSRFARAVSVLASVVITSSLFAAVAVGLTSTDELAFAAAAAVHAFA
jgi:hypothetical protein